MTSTVPGSPDLHYLTLSQLSGLIRLRLLSAREAVDHQLSRIATTGASLGAYSFVAADQARARADELDRELGSGRWRGPLHGVPIAVKDIYEVAGWPAEMGMPVRVGTVSTTTATVVTRLVDAGAVILGKLHTTEGVYAEHTAPFTAPLNPWDTSRWVGVSSSGSGVAAAAGLAFATLGSDTGGSIRMPAAATGATGLKPTWGRVSRAGVFELAATLDHVGPLCRSVEDAAAILQVIAGPDPHDPTAALRAVPDLAAGDVTQLTGMRVGVDVDWALTDTSEDVQRALREALEVFRSLGAVIVPLRFPPTVQVVEDWFAVCGVQTARAHGGTYPGAADQYGPALRELIELGRGLSGTQYQELLLRRADFKGRAVAALAPVDAMIVPGLPFVAPPAADMVRMDAATVARVHRYTVPFTMSQLPTLTMPGGFSADGLPAAIQLVAGEFGEVALVRLGAAFQRVTPWADRHPDL